MWRNHTQWVADRTGELAEKYDTNAISDPRAPTKRTEPDRHPQTLSSMYLSGAWSFVFYGLLTIRTCQKISYYLKALETL